MIYSDDEIEKRNQKLNISEKLRRNEKKNICENKQQHSYHEEEKKTNKE